jgi:hypothetical protein
MTELQIHTHITQNTADICRDGGGGGGGRWNDRRPNRISKEILKYQQKKKPFGIKKMGLCVTYK